MKIRSATLLFLLCAAPSFCKAQLVITEVMYDPPGTDYGHEWFEVFNAGTSSIALSKYKLLEGAAKHNIIAVGDQTIEANTYAIVAENAADFENDHPGFAGEIFHAAFSLDNAGATLSIVDASSSVIASATYDSAIGALGDGNSLQRLSDDDQFVARTPSPGAPMSSSAITQKIKLPATKSASSSKSKQRVALTSNDTEKIPAQGNVASPPAGGSQVAIAEIGGPANSLWWWIGAAALAVASAAALFLAKRYKNREWDLIEES